MLSCEQCSKNYIFTIIAQKFFFREKGWHWQEKSKKPSLSGVLPRSSRSKPRTSLIPKPNLIYTIAIDPPGHGGTRQLAKMLAASLARTYFGGEVIVFRNSVHPLFLTQRQWLNEIFVEVPEAEEIAGGGGRHAELIGRPWMELGGWGQRNGEYPDGDVKTPEQLRPTPGLADLTDAAEKSGFSDQKWGKAQVDALARVAMSWKYRARNYIDASKYGWVMFIDADCLALRNLDHLLPILSRQRGSNLAPPLSGLYEEVEAEILYQPEPGRSVVEEVFAAYLGDPMTEKPTKMGDGINSGTWAVRGEHYQAVMEVWEAIEMTRPQCMTQWTEQGAWNRLIFEVGRMRDVKEPADPLEGSVLPNLLLGKLAGLRARAFEVEEVQFPLHLHKDWKRYKEAALLHAAGGTLKEKIEFLYGMFMQRFYGDAATTLVNILET